MLTKLTLQDFQSWKALELDLSPVVVIVGETDSGKSALLRALSSVLFNALEGSSFVKKGATKASVTVETRSGDRITLERGITVNRYLLNGKALDKIGRDVPPEVSSALQIEEVVFEEGGSLTLQFQPQMDAPFLLTDQGVRATRLLGSVSKVATLYKAARTAGQRSKDTSARLKLHEEAVEQCKTRLAVYDGLQILRPKVQALGNAVNSRQDLQRQLDKVRQAHWRLEVLYNKQYDLQVASSEAFDRKNIYVRKVTIVTQRDIADSIRSRLGDMLARVASMRGKELALQLNMCTLGDRVVKYEHYDRLKRAHTKLLGFRGALRILPELDGRELVAAASVVALSKRVQVLEKELLCPVCGREQT